LRVPEGFDDKGSLKYWRFLCFEKKLVSKILEKQFIFHVAGYSFPGCERIAKKEDIKLTRTY